jgi:hypothetical protein
VSDFPKINSATIARGFKALREELDTALEELYPEIVAYFLSMIPERGRKLQGRFRLFQRRNGRAATFTDFVEATVYRAPITRAFLPSGCRRTRQPAIHEIIERICPKKPTAADEAGVEKYESLLIVGIRDIHLGRGDLYQLVQKHCCSACTIARCAHKPR